MYFELLLRNPEQYRCGPNFRGTSFTFPVVFFGKKYVVKTIDNETKRDMFERYCVLQDKFFFGMQFFRDAQTRLMLEARRLQELNGRHAPKIMIYDDSCIVEEYSDPLTNDYHFLSQINERRTKPSIVREFIDGKTLRELPDKDKAKTLDEAVVAMQDIHNHGIFFDPHVKNLVASANDAYWVEVGRAKKQGNPTKAKAENLLKFIYSTYTFTRDRDMTLHSAEAVTRNYQEKSAVECASRLALANMTDFNYFSRCLKDAKAYFPTRVPITPKGVKLHKEITAALLS
jgi:predicted Ser/Thr protein kinase